MISVSPRLCRRFFAAAAGLLSAIVIGCSHGGSSGGSGPQGSGSTTQVSDTHRDVDFSDSGDASRGLEPPSTLSPQLQKLIASSGETRDLGDSGAPATQPSPDEVGYSAPDSPDVFMVAIHVAPEVDVKALTTAGANIQMRLGNIIYASVHARDLEQVSQVDGVKLVAPLPAGRVPPLPRAPLHTDSAGGTRELEVGNGDSAKFDHQQLDGKGVIVGIVDTGIDWKHKDFQNPDGTSRILYLWDIWDNTWEKSGHKVGSEPPMTWDGTKPMGTVYTNEQINAALKGDIKIARRDLPGHGTACAGTAAGNDLGVAPKADIVFVSTYQQDSDNSDNDGSCGVQGAYWITQIAAQRHEPCVISLSFGGHDTPHDGTGEWAEGFNAVDAEGSAPGVVICASAGNEGEDTMHARGHFGPLRQGEMNQGFAPAVELYVQNETLVGAIFDSRDDWRLRVVGLDKFLWGSDNNRARLDFSKDPDTHKQGLDRIKIIGSDNVKEADRKILRALKPNKNVELDTLPNNTDVLSFKLEPGSYLIAAGGNSDKVTRGLYDLYLPEVNDASFGRGSDHKMVVGSPGDADDLITVGSYDFRNEWENSTGTVTHCDQISLGDISAYSSAGFRRDGVIKPDIAAPGQFTISTLSEGCKLAEEMGGASAITKDGKHVAWAGTSASCPFTAGVVALMLEKNPQLTEDQVKQILRSTADHDLDTTGAVPNPEWGYGKLNPEKALAAVPAPTAEPATQPSPLAGAAVVQSFSGTFKGEGFTLELVANADGSYTGSLAKNTGIVPVKAKVVGKQLEGVAMSGGEDFEFTATVDGDVLTLTSGGQSFKLKRQGTARGFGEDDEAAIVGGGSAAGASGGASRDLGGGSQPLTLRMMEIDDPMINDWPAYKLLVPDGWRFQGSIHWNQDAFTMVSPVIMAHDPSGLPGVMVYEQGSYITGIREQRLQMTAGIEGAAPYIAQQFAEGNLYLGKEIRELRSPPEFIKQFVIPLHRPDLAQANAVSMEDAPKFAKIYVDAAANSIPGIHVDAVKVRFAYELKGQPVDEDMYCAIVQFPVAGLTCWTSNVVSFAAPHGEMDQSMPVLTTIITSARPQLKWVNACMQVSQMIQQNNYQAIAEEGALSRYISQCNDQISADIQEHYDYQCKVEDQVAQEWHEYIMGVNTYAGPNGPVELPNTGTWYVDPQGVYHQVVPGGQGPSSSWTPLQPQQHGG